MAATFESPGTVGGWSPCSVDGAGLAILARDGERLSVHGFGDAVEVVDRMAGAVARWDAAGRPASESLAIRAYPAGTAPAAGGGALRIQKRWSTFLVDWPGA